MATAITKIIDANSQKEGTRICAVDQQGNVQAYGGKELDADKGYPVWNTKWAARSWGNGGAVS